MRPLKDILSSGGASIEALLKEAFEAGKAEAASEMRARIAAAIDSSTLSYLAGSFPTNATSSPLLASEQEGRASPGTVKPAIISLIRQAKSNGITTDELIDLTHFKPNSVRGTVSTLHSEQAIRKAGDRWVSADLPLTESERAIKDMLS